MPESTGSTMEIRMGIETEATIKAFSEGLVNDLDGYADNVDETIEKIDASRPGMLRIPGDGSSMLGPTASGKDLVLGQRPLNEAETWRIEALTADVKAIRGFAVEVRGGVPLSVVAEYAEEDVRRVEKELKRHIKSMMKVPASKRFDHLESFKVIVTIHRVAEAKKIHAVVQSVSDVCDGVGAK